MLFVIRQPAYHSPKGFRRTALRPHLSMGLPARSFTDQVNPLLNQQLILYRDYFFSKTGSRLSLNLHYER